ncbi:MAG TPA: hypothetical protein DHW77_08270 [Verrucomicrobiales bacterium]|nr:hypothetical protein [Verrucomicrobiales bacterium]HCL97743.1 hypothetical protein [Verrucomicrobiales bacterium]
MEPDDSKNEFESAQHTAGRNIFSELWGFLATNKKWWLGPIILVLLAFGLLIMLGGTAAAPFVYSLF